MEQVSIFGYTSPKNVNDWKDEFKLSNYSGIESIYVCKETFHHEGDGLEFDYKYYVRFWDESEFTNSDKIAYNLNLVVMPTSLHQTMIDELAMQFDESFDTKDIEVKDVIDYLCASVKFAEDECDSWSDVDEVMTRISNVFKRLDEIKGFFLNKAWNMNGNTGWDTLNHAVNGTDLFATYHAQDGKYN